LLREAVAESVSSDSAKRFDDYVQHVENLPQTIQPKFEPESQDWLGQLEEIRARSSAKNVISPSSLKGQDPQSVEEDLSFVSEGTEDTNRVYVAGDIAGSDVASLGNAFHAVMEQIIVTRSTELSEQLNDFMASSLNKYGATAYQDRLTKMVERVFTSKLLVRILTADNALPELEMSETNDKGVLVEGFADLVIQEGNDLTVIDYKTNLELTAEKISHYKFQLDAYSKIIEVATGFEVKQKLLWHVLPDRIEEIAV
jgi:ATP-dependent exoDNAse (exonuclease V) beta subunit